MSADGTTPFDVAAAFQQLLQGQNEVLRRLSLAEGRLLSLEQPSKAEEHPPPKPRDTPGVPRYYKLDFPTFDGKEDPLGWLNRCEQFFRGQRTMEEEKVWLASYHLVGIAQQWYYQLERDEGLLSWARFKEMCHLRFGPPIRSNPLGELMHLRQTDSVDDYQQRFGALICRADSVTPTQQVQIFTAGLSDPLRTDVELQRPNDLQHAMSLARAFERRYHTAPAASILGRPPARPNLARTPASRSVDQPPAPLQGRTIRRLTTAEMAERRQQGLCFNCDESYVRGHRCKRLFFLDVIDDDEDNPKDISDDVFDTSPEISLHAITGIPTASTMQLAVKIQGHHCLALIDSGSTNNFLSMAVIKGAGLPLVPKPGLSVAVANGDRLPSAGLCSNLALNIGDEIFSEHFFALPLDGFDVVLGCQFLKCLGPILWDFSELTMSFWRVNRRVTWSGAEGTTPHACVLTSDDLLQSLLTVFEDLFLEPQELPPSRAFDHRISLLPNSTPVAVRPYRYPHMQKDEIEKQCAAMMEQGIIRPSTSPFSSPVLLVKKQDMTWRFCIDYRALNAITVKDKFPIPVVDELLDELKHAHFFTKLDLRSGYHQVRMHEADIHKTAFRTHHGHFEFLVMPFGLSNAPSTFQALMNDVLRPFLRQFALVFFDDILIYSSSWAEHLQHVRTILLQLRNHKLKLKRSKCSFGQTSIAYLGHVITHQGVTMDQSKVQAISDWPAPANVRALRGFLGLAGYYRRFIQNYGMLAAPLTKLLQKGSYSWSPEAAEAFAALKSALSGSPVLQLPDFTLPFIVECDASGSGFGAVLHQGNGPIAYFSRPVPVHHAKLAAYERELIGLVKAVRHWRPYLWGTTFLIRTDHYSLKYLLDQRLSTIPQHTWVSKLFGFDFQVEYRPGKGNTVADALSRRDEDPSLHVMSSPSFAFYDNLRKEVAEHPAYADLHAHHIASTLPPGWCYKDGLFVKHGRIFLGSGSAFISPALQLAHGVGHEGVEKTMHRLRSNFIFPDIKKAVKDFVAACSTCQMNKSVHLHPAGLLQPLPVPTKVWADISIDFIDGFPKVHGKSVILSVVDRLSKYSHFIALAHPYTAQSVALAFFETIVKLHGVPESIVSDRDPVFTSKFWQELFRLQGVHLKLSSAFHPQTDGQTEVVNRTIEMYLRCLACDRPRTWLQWLPWAEFCYNTSYHSALKATPFEVVYGRPVPSLLPYTPGDTNIEAMDICLKDRDELLHDARQRLLQAQQRMKEGYDKAHRDVSYSIGQWVLLRLNHRLAVGIRTKTNAKLAPRFYGPYKILERVGEVAYRLELPANARIHDVFHVSLLKPFHGTPPSELPPLPPLRHGHVTREPSAVTSIRHRDNSVEVLVEWKDHEKSDASWEDFSWFRAQYPSFQLADELLAQAGGSVTDLHWGQVYTRRNKTHSDSEKI
ncbi:polyprotein [Rhynchospora pubera]|uniref:Polyprotein n=1 Tax=Rhynchospora pubera TaxID=906938 RepID=A0AAV8CQA2_9POAL|nr:polyprotein [Rhynchospora pubera]